MADEEHPPRERPPDRLQAADQRHRALMFGVEDRSEFLGWLKLWAWFQEEQAQKDKQSNQTGIAVAAAASVNLIQDETTSRIAPTSSWPSSPRIANVR